jgi:TonB-linked SusC/RagA family outer membrane protein
MKKILTIGGISPHAVKKALLVMKLTFLLIFVAVLQVSAKVNGQGRVSLNLRQVEIAKALNSIEKQGVYRFLYNSRLTTIRKKIDIDAKDLEIRDLLKNMFTGTDLTYRILENNLIVVLSNTLTAQDIKITGKVTGENGEGLAGVSITVKGTSNGTSTDNTGNFTITAPEKGRLLVSYIGYESQDIPINSQSVINIKLTAAKKLMDEVVVIGYGQASKRDLTGSIVKVDGKEVADKPNTNPVSSLQGKVTGLTVVNSGTPGKSPDIRIRGTVSLGQVHPLYVVDGILNDNIDYVNPNDIESIEVLKDPSSLAIFGVKGATGVIAITTKRAKAGQSFINLNSNYGFKTLVDKIKMANAQQFATLFAEENANNNVPTPDYSAFNANTDWIEAVTRTAHFNTNNLSVAGSSENNKFNLGIGYTTDEGIIKREVLKKLQLSFADEYKVNKAVRVGVNFATTRKENPYDATGVLDDARKIQPQVSAAPKLFNVPNPYGPDTIAANVYSALALQGSGIYNPTQFIENEWNTRISTEYRYVGSVFAEVNFLRYFTLRGTYYGDVSNLDDRHYTPIYYSYSPIDNKTFLFRDKTSLVQNNQDWKKWQQDYILTFKKSFGDHNVTATGGFTTYYTGTFQRQVKVNQGSGPADQPIPNDPHFWYVNSGYGVIDPSISTDGTGTYSSQGEATTVSWLGRVLYNYQGKYYLNASLRDDASSQIPPKNRHQRFWAVGGAWELTREDFMKTQTLVDFLKIKGSVGVLGNQTTNQENVTPVNFNYPFYPGLRTGSQQAFADPSVTTIVNAATPLYKRNPDLKWESVDAWEAGVELSAFASRLHFEANYFNRKTKDLMTFVDRSQLGLDNELINGGNVRNQGVELSAIWNQRFDKDLSISIAGNITFLSNKMLSLAPDLQATGNYLSRTSENNGSAEARTTIGHPIGTFFGYVVDGLYQSNLDILKSPSASSLGSYRPGDFKFKDINKDGIIDAKDRTIIGNPSPKYTYGGSVTVNYKGFSLDVDVSGVYGNDIFRTWGSLESPFQRVNYPAFKINRWHGAGTSNWDPIVSQADRFNYNGSTYNIEDGSYFRIRNVQLAYGFSTKLLSTVHIKNLRLFANVQNLKTWKHNKGYSPEYPGDATSFGFDHADNALPRITTLGLNVSF